MKRKAGRGTTRKAVGDKTAWGKLAAMQDRDIKFTKDAPRTAPSDWANAIAHRGLPLPSRNASRAP